MSVTKTLSRAGFLQRTGRRGFCPACRLWAPDPSEGSRVEIAPAAVTALAFLAVSAVAWWVLVRRSGAMSGIAIEPGTLGSFAVSWTVMMAAMMLPSALPLVFEFGRRSEGRTHWRAAAGLLGIAYLGVWLAFGVACYILLAAVPASWFDHRMVGALALGLAGFYGLTPIKRASEARCRELCALHGPLPFDLMRSAAIVGAKYGLSCVGCSGGLMVAVVIIGMSNFVWMIALAAFVLVYKLGPSLSLRQAVLLSAVLGALGVVYAVVR
jgi:predicted metal-binding membrane protein